MCIRDSPENEHQIQKAFETLTRNKTVLMIAHRLSTVQNADNIIVLSEGKIAEQGSHSALLESCLLYTSGTSVLPALSCFCWRSVNCWRIGLGRNP